MEHLTSLFLSQSYADTWDDYKRSLVRPDFLCWDYIILTASNEQQAEGFRAQLAQRQQAGLNKYKAILEAAVQRLRPILMTSISTILGLLPLMFASGEGANGRIAMGTAVVGGLLISTLLTLFVIPVMYVYLSTDREVQKSKKRERKIRNG